MKPTGLLTNSVRVATELNRKCPNRRARQRGEGRRPHQHVTLTNGRAKAAEVYVDQLCAAICKGLRDQIAADKQGRFTIA